MVNKQQKVTNTQKRDFIWVGKDVKIQVDEETKRLFWFYLKMLEAVNGKRFTQREAVVLAIKTSLNDIRNSNPKAREFNEVLYTENAISTFDKGISLYTLMKQSDNKPEK